MSERNNTPVQEEVQTGESLSELLQIRRNKLNELMESGQNPSSGRAAQGLPPNTGEDLH